MNLQQFSDSGMLFEYYRVRLHHVAPLSGPMAGGTELIVSGEGFQPASYKGMWCWFAEAQRTEATYESSVEVRCKSPSSGLAKVVDVKIQVDEAFLEGAVQYTYVQAGVVRTIEPLNGPRMGGTAVTIQGENLVMSITTACRFGNACLLYTSPSPRD